VVIKKHFLAIMVFIKEANEINKKTFENLKPIGYKFV
jgi:hypothetical protein